MYGQSKGGVLRLFDEYRQAIKQVAAILKEVEKLSGGDRWVKIGKNQTNKANNWPADAVLFLGKAEPV